MVDFSVRLASYLISCYPREQLSGTQSCCRAPSMVVLPCLNFPEVCHLQGGSSGVELRLHFKLALFVLFLFTILYNYLSRENP